MNAGILKEPAFEARVSFLPEHLSSLKKLAEKIYVETGAGHKAFAADEQYINAGASIMNREQVIRESDILFCMHLPGEEDMEHLSSKVIVGNYQPYYNMESIQTLARNNITAFSLDMIPRTTRAQSMDILSSQANIAGYKAVIIAANIFPKYFPMFMTAAGSIAPAKVLILGAGVAGLQAIATARRLGAVVEVFDTRPAVKEEVQSLGAKFIEVEGAADPSSAGGYAVQQTEDFLQRQKQKIADAVAKADIVITTAQIHRKKAPLLINEEMINKMKHGSVIIDLASATGGNTALTRDKQTITTGGITIVGDSHLAATMPADASKLYGKNILNFLHLVVDAQGNFNLNMDDDLVKGTCICSGGNLLLQK